MANDTAYADLLDSLSPLTRAGIDPDEARMDRAGTMARLLGQGSTQQQSPQLMAQNEAAPRLSPNGNPLPPGLYSRQSAPTPSPAAPAPAPAAVPAPVPATVTPSGSQSSGTPSLAAGNAAVIRLGQQNYAKASGDVDAEASLPDLEAQTKNLEAMRQNAAQPVNAYNPATGKLLAPYKPSIGQRLVRGVEGFARGGVFGAVDPRLGGAQPYGAPNAEYGREVQQKQQMVNSYDQQLKQDQAIYADKLARAKQTAADREKLVTDLPSATSPSIAQQKEDAGPEKLSDMYSSAVADALSRGADPSKDPKVQQLADAITGVQKQPAPKEPTRDDKAIAIYAKPPAERTPEENAYLKGYEQYVKTTKVDPGVARTDVWMQMPVAVADPDHPGNVIYETRRDAIGMGSPQGIDTQVPKKTAIDFTSGPEARTLTSFNTAQEHLKQLDAAATALGNGDIQLLNQIGNAFATATGSPAPTNFDAIKNAVAGEVSKTFKGTGATDAEISQIESTVNHAQSPAQLRGAIKNYVDLLQSKKNALQQQYEQGRQGKPNFNPPEGSKADDPMGLR